TIVDLPLPMSPVSREVSPAGFSRQMRWSKVPQFSSSSSCRRYPARVSLPSSVAENRPSVIVASLLRRGVLGQFAGVVAECLGIHVRLQDAAHLPLLRTAAQRTQETQLHHLLDRGVYLVDRTR